MSSDEVPDLARTIAEADGPPHPVQPGDVPNPAIGFLGLLLYPLKKLVRR